MTIVRKDFEIKLSADEIDALNNTQYYLTRLLKGIDAQLSEDEKKSDDYFAIKNNVQKILNDIITFWDTPKIVLD